MSLIFYILLVRVSPAGREFRRRFLPGFALLLEWTEKVHSSLPSALALSEIPDFKLISGFPGFTT